jgi:pimeloyl-ACP methyl ester carboxylesterase
MRVLFCHGLESGPHGRKYQALDAAGYAPIAPDCRGMNLMARVDVIAPLLAGASPPLVIGSSYGGLAAVCAAAQHACAGGELGPMILCAPALGHSEPPADTWIERAPALLSLRAPLVILHGTRDKVVPIAVSRAFAAAAPGIELIEVDDDHSLSGSVGLLLSLVARWHPGP